MWAVDPGKRRGSEIFHCGDGHSYYKNRESRNEDGQATTIYLRCTKYRSHACQGSAQIQVEAIQQLWQDGEDHICHPDNTASAKRHMRYECLNASAARPFDQPQDVYESVAIRYVPTNLLN